MKPLLARGAAKRPRPAGPAGPWVYVAAWGPCGFAPVAPGTFGTLGAIPLWWALARLPVGWYVAATVALAPSPWSRRTTPGATGGSWTRPRS